MKKASLVVTPPYFNNKIFDLSDSIINRDGCMVPFARLKEKFFANGYDLSTQDLNRIEESDCVIYIEMPAQLPEPDFRHKSFLLLFETELVLPQNWDIKRHEAFKAIFTWNDSFVDNKKYFKINWSYNLPEKIEKIDFDKKKFCCLIAGNKQSKHALELYSKRVESIRWFEANHADEFDLYGMGWNEVRFPGKRLFEHKAIFRPLLRMLGMFSKKFPSFRGPIKAKREVLRQYKFSICYENARDIPGYITEKIFDCFFAGCVPVYWGTNNICDHVPANCFIDKTEFKSYEELYCFLKHISEEKYLSYISAVEGYLRGNLVEEFSSDYFADKIFSIVSGQK